jgi:GT2 family glycosyltransferase
MADGDAIRPVPSKPTFSVVVPPFHRPEALRETLAALAHLNYRSDLYEVIIVDDGADDLTAEIVNRFRGRGFELTLETQDRRGAATARNRGARLATGDVLLFVDDDIVVAREHLTHHARTMEGHRDALVNGAWEFSPSVTKSLSTTSFGRFRIDLERQFQTEAMGTPWGDGIVEMALLGTWDLAVRRDLFWEIGGFDEAFPVAGAEDQDFSLRARHEGVALLLDTKIKCLHNDNRLTLRDYGAREERSARTMPVLARKYPAEFGEVPYVRENRPVVRSDPPGLMAKKLAKAALASGPALEAFHRLIDVLETARVPEPVLRRLYRSLLGLHLFRGFRRS